MKDAIAFLKAPYIIITNLIKKTILKRSKAWYLTPKIWKFCIDPILSDVPKGTKYEKSCAFCIVPILSDVPKGKKHEESCATYFYLKFNKEKHNQPLDKEEHSHS